IIRVRIAVSPPFVDKQLHAPRECVVIRSDKSSFSRSDVLALLKAEAGNSSNRSDQPFRMAREESLRTILNHWDTAGLGEDHDFVHLTWIAEKMSNDDGPGALAEGGLNGVCGYIPSPGIHFRKDGNSCLVQDRCKRSHIGDRAGNKFVPRFRV